MASPEFESDEPPTFREVMAYLDGVAHAMTATRSGRHPVSLVACSGSAASTPAPCSRPGGVEQPSGNDWSCGETNGAQRDYAARVTIRYGERSIAIERTRPAGGSQSIVATSAARSGARVIDFGLGGNVVEPGLPCRDTLPYGAATVSIAPSGTGLQDQELRTSDVYLRCARLSPEWYDLTGSGGTPDAPSRK